MYVCMYVCKCVLGYMYNSSLHNLCIMSYYTITTTFNVVKFVYVYIMMGILSNTVEVIPIIEAYIIYGIIYGII